MEFLLQWKIAKVLGLLPGMSTKKQTAPLLDAETGVELTVPVIRKSPCVKLVTIFPFCRYEQHDANAA